MYDDFINNPHVQNIQQNRVSTGSVQTTSTVNTLDTRASSVVPAATANLGVTEEELANLNAKETGQLYFNTNAGRVAAERLDNRPLSQAYAQQLNKDGEIQNAKVYRAKREAEQNGKKLKAANKRYLKLIFMALAVLALLGAAGGAAVALSSDGNEGNVVASPDGTNSPTTSPTTTLTQAPTTNPTVSTEAPTNNTESPTNSPSQSPTTNPTQNPTFNPTLNPTQNPTISPTLNPTTSPIDPGVENVPASFIFSDDAFITLCENYDEELNQDRVLGLCKDSLVHTCVDIDGSLVGESLCFESDNKPSSCGCKVEEGTTNALSCAIRENGEFICVGLDEVTVSIASDEGEKIKNLVKILRSCDQDDIFASCLHVNENTVLICENKEISRKVCEATCPCPEGEFFVPTFDFCEISEEDQCLPVGEVPSRSLGVVSRTAAAFACENRVVTLVDESVNFCENGETFVCEGNTFTQQTSCSALQSCVCESRFSSIDQDVCGGEVKAEQCSEQSLFFADQVPLATLFEIEKRCSSEDINGTSFCITDIVAVNCLSNGEVELDTPCTESQVCGCAEGFLTGTDACCISP